MTTEAPKKKRARFPARGSVVTRAYPVEKVTQIEGETDADFATRKAWADALADVDCDIVLLSREDVLALKHRRTAWAVAEEKRKADLEKAGERVPVMTVEGAREYRALAHDIVVKTIRQVRGIDLGAQAVEDLAGDALANALADINLIGDFASLGLGAQDPTPEQLDC